MCVSRAREYLFWLARQIQQITSLDKCIAPR
jgi:hypothetical protein